jgi:putative acetyltransferase
MPVDPIIRPERPDDVEAIAAVTALAFRTHPHSRQTEPFIIAALRRAGALAVSLVAELEGELSGHIAFSPVAIADGSPDWYALGPVAVSPHRQRQGIGSALVRAGLAALCARGAAGCILAGEPAFYSRFGFRRFPELTMAGVPPEVILALAFGAGRPSGAVTHHPAFGARS